MDSDVVRAIIIIGAILIDVVFFIKFINVLKNLNQLYKNGYSLGEKKEILWIIGFVISLSVTIPIFINEAYTANEVLYYTKWSASELLQYAGSIIGAFATIVAVFLTILYTMHLQNESFKKMLDLQNKETRSMFDLQKEDTKNRVKPFLYSQLNKLNKEDALKENADVYIELESFSKYFELRSNIKPLNILLEKVPDESFEKNKFLKKFNHEVYILRYVLKNIGVGAAINTVFNINGVKVCSNFALQSNAEIKFIIVLKNVIEQQYKNKKIVFSFEYYDVMAENLYRQRESFTLFYDDEGNIISERKWDEYMSIPEESKMTLN